MYRILRGGSLLLILALSLTVLADPASAQFRKKQKRDAPKLPAWTTGAEVAEYPQMLFWTAPGQGPDLVSASDQARAQVTAQIQVRIKSVVSSTEEELTEGDRRYYSAAYSSTVESLVDESIQGIEIVQTHSAGGTYYALAALNKNTYLGGLEAELRDYADQLGALYDDAQRNLDRGEVFTAIENLSDAVAMAPEVYPRQNFYNALADMNFNLPSNLQAAALLSHVREVVSSIDLELVKGDKQVSAPGQRLPRPIVVKATLQRKGAKLPIAEMPLRATYASGDRAAKLATDDMGMAEFMVSAVPGDRPDAGYVVIEPNLGRMPDIMGPQLKDLELRVNYRIEGEAAAFAVSVKSKAGKRLPEVEAAVEAVVLKAGFRIDPKSSMLIQGIVTTSPTKEIEVGGSATYQAEALLRLEVIDLKTKANKGSLEVNKQTVSKNREDAGTQAMNKVGGAVKRKALTEMLGDALAK